MRIEGKAQLKRDLVEDPCLYTPASLSEILKPLEVHSGGPTVVLFFFPLKDTKEQQLQGCMAGHTSKRTKVRAPWGRRYVYAPVPCLSKSHGMEILLPQKHRLLPSCLASLRLQSQGCYLACPVVLVSENVSLRTHSTGPAFLPKAGYLHLSKGFSPVNKSSC